MNDGSDYLLIVEDDPDILNLLETTLTFRGYRAIVARNGKEGLEAVRKERPTLIIADIMMPKLDGFGLVHRLRLDSKTRDIPVIFITATYVLPEDRDFALNIGATRFIQKPLELKEFLKTIEELLIQDASVEVEPLNEYTFYEGYRTRLETKLAEINKQIARDKFLLGGDSGKDEDFLNMSLRRSSGERDELESLLDEVYEQLKKYKNPK